MRLRLSNGYLVVVCLTLTACTDDDGSLVASADSGNDSAADGGFSGDATSDADADAGPAPDTGLATDAVETDTRDAGALAPEATLVMDGYAAEGVAETLRVETSGEIATVAWQFGSRDVENTVSETASVSVTYARRGRYTLNAVVRFADGTSRTVSGRLTVVPETLWQQNHSSTIAVSPNDERVAVVSPDSNEVAVFERDGNTLSVLERVATCDDPRTVALVGDSRVAVACQDSDTVWVMPVPSAGASGVEVTLPWGARPFGIIQVGDSLWVTGQGRGELYEIAVGTGELLRTIAVGSDARAIAALPDGTLAVSRWRADDEVSLVYLVDPTTGAVDTMVIEADRQLSSDTETPGVINYLGPVVVSPWGDRAAITGTQANIFQGLFRNGEPLSHETT
ncbi:MAG: beta-propeller fold lactonase family protein, partial [Myxococcales bacterium]|nr:beta-propeller fold lactonase family protein [Myxococcales bacterium]